MRKLLHLLCVILGICTISLNAQDIKDMPSIAYVYPAGAKTDSTVNVVIGGTNFSNVQSVEISGGGVKAKIASKNIFSTRNQFVVSRNKLQELLIKRKIIKKEDIQDKKIVYKVDYTKCPDLKKYLTQMAEATKTNRYKRSTQDAFAQSLHLKITVDKDAKLGKRTLKIIGKDGASNSMPFYIDNLPEFSERSLKDRNKAIAMEKEDGLISAEVLKKDQSTAFEKQKPEIKEVQLPIIINGQVDLLQTDIYKFKATEGQKIVAFVQARDLIYYIGDGVPGWFQAAISIKDSRNREVAYADDFFQNPDPLLMFTAPKTDTYTLEIKDAIYRGREDFVYRISLGELPFISRTYPLGGSLEEGQTLKLYGFNLHRTYAEITQKLRPSYNELKLAQGNERQAKLLYQATDLKNLDLATTNNKSKENAFEVALGQSINSILMKKGEKHFYKLVAKENASVVAEVFARRLGSPIDTYLEVLDANMNLITKNDDFEDFSDGLNTHHADSKVDFSLKAGEIYYIVLRETQNKAGVEYAYKLNIYEPTPDFEAKTSPATINVLKGKSTPFNVSVFRKNEGKFPIEIRLKNAPKGISLSGTEIPANADSVMMVLHCDKSLKNGLHNLKFEAFTKIGNREIIKDVIPCEDMLQAFYYAHLVPTDTHSVYVINNNTNNASKNIKIQQNATELVPNKIEIPHGGTVTLNIGTFNSNKIIPELRDSSQGISIEKFQNTKEGCIITLKSNAETSSKGQSANLIVDVYIEKGTKKKQNRIRIDTIKAIAYTIGEL